MSSSGYNASAGRDEGVTTITELDVSILIALLGPEWRAQKLQHLDFSDSAFQLTSLKIKENDEDRAFAPLSRGRVISIDLTKNRLDSLAQIRGEDFPSLKILRCKANQLLSDAVMLALPRLKELYLGRNQLTSVPPLAGLPALEVLILNHNKIQTESFGKDLVKGKELKKVDLRGNVLANSPNNFMKSLVRLASLSNLQMFKLAENPFCPLFPEYQAVLYGFLVAAGISLNQLDRISIAGARDDHMLEVYEQLVTTVVLPTAESMRENIFDQKLISPNSGKVVFDVELPSVKKEALARIVAAGGMGSTTAGGTGITGAGGAGGTRGGSKSKSSAPSAAQVDERKDLETVQILAGDLILLDHKLAGYKLDTFMLANPQTAFKFPLTIRFLQLSHLTSLFEERLGSNMAGGGGGKSLFGPVLSQVGGKNKHDSIAGHNLTSAAAQSKLPQLTLLIAYYEDIMTDASTLMQQLELVFRLATKISMAAVDQFPEIFGRERMTAVQYQRFLRGKSQAERDEMVAAEQNVCEQFCQTVRILHERYAGFVSTVSPLLFRTLAKLSVVNGPGTGGLGTKCLFCLSELGKAHEEEVLDLVEEMLLPELQMIPSWQETTSADLSVAETLVTGLNFFGPTEPYFRPSVILGYRHESFYFSRKMSKVVKKLCEFFRHDVAGNVPTEQCAHASPQFAALLKHCVASPEVASLPVAKDTIPEMLHFLFTEKQIHAEESSPARAKMFKDYLKTAIFMMVHTKDDAVVRSLMPCLELFASQVQQLARTGPLNDLSAGVCAAMALLMDAITCMMVLNPEALAIFISQNPTEKGVFEKHLPFLIDIMNEQIAEPLLLSASLRCFNVVLTHSAKTRAAWIELAVRPTYEKPAGVLEIILPYMGGKKYRAIYERCATILDGSGEGEKQSIVTPPLAMCYNMFVHECLIALVDFVKVFTSLADTDSFCDKMSELLNQRGREKILFSLLSVPDQVVQESAMGCIRCVSLDELEADEIEFLVGMLDVSKPGQNIQGGLLFAVLNQLRELCVNEGSTASKVFRNQFVEVTSRYVFDILHKNLLIITYSKEANDAKAKLNFGCLDYLLVVSKAPQLRAHLRLKELSCGRMPAILKAEESISEMTEQDVFVERTWSGRNLEALLSALTGPQKLSVRSPQAFRVFVRIADVLQGRPDSLEPLAELKYDVLDGKLYVDVLALREEEMFDAARIEKEMRGLDDQEWDDRVSQHQSFATFHGLDLMLTYLEAQLGTADEDILTVNIGQMVYEFGAKHSDRTERLAQERKMREQAEEIVFPVEKVPPDWETRNTTDHFFKAFLETVGTDYTRDEYIETHKSYFSEGEDKLETLLARAPNYHEVPFVLGGASSSGSHRPVQTEQGCNVNAIVAAFLRSVYCMLLVPCAHNLKKTIMTWVRSRVTLQRLLRLLNSLEDMTEYHVAAKFLRILNISHKCGARDLEQLREILPAEVPQSRLDVLFLLQDYLTKLMAMLVPRCRNYARTGVKLNEQQEVLSLELLMSFHLITNLLPMFSYARYYIIHLQCLNLIFYQFFRPTVDNFIEFCLYDLRLDHSQSFARISKEFAFSGNRRVPALDFGMEILARCMQFSPSLKYDILEKFSKSPEVMRLPYLKQLLHLYQMCLYSSSVEILLNWGEQRLALQPPAKERVLHLLEVQFPAKTSAYYRPQTATDQLLLCVTSKRVLLLQKDISRAVYWLHPALEGPCGVCPTQAFCPKLPQVLFSYNFDKLCRVVDGWSQGLALGFTAGKSEKIELLQLKTSTMAKRRVFDHLETFSTCGISADAMLRISPDVLGESALIFKVGDTQIVGVQFVQVQRVKTLDIPRHHGPNFALQEAAELYGGKEFAENSLIVLTEGEFFEFGVNWHYWVPPFEDTDEDGAALQEEIRAKLRGRIIPKMATETLADRGGGSAGSYHEQFTDQQLKKHADRSRIRERTEYDQFMNSAAKGAETVEQKTSAMQRVRSNARQQFMFEHVAKLSAETPTVAQSGACFVKEEDVTLREKKKKAVTKCHAELLQNRFHASISTLMTVEMGTLETASIYLRFQDEILHLRFDHDAARETFRRALALVLNQEDVVWERNFS